MRAADGRERRQRRRRAVRALGRRPGSSVAQSWMTDPDAGEGADPHLGASSTTVRCGACTPARRWPTPSAWPPAIRGCCGCSPASRCRTGPPTRRFRGLVVEHGGEHPGTLDLKHGGLVPILDLARWGAMAAGVTSATTAERLRAAAEAGTLAPADAHTLRDAFELINNLRLEHQVAQMRAGARARRPRRSRGAELADARPAASGVPRRGHDPEARGRRARTPSIRQSGRVGAVT